MNAKDAIARSAHIQETVVLEDDGHAVGLHAALEAACDDWSCYSDQEHTATTEYWGTDPKGRDWRVHVKGPERGLAYYP